MADPDWHDPKAAGWWLWGICAWNGSGWCSGDGPWTEADGEFVKGDAGTGVSRRLPHLGDAGNGINRKLPHLANPGAGINRKLKGTTRRDYILGICRDLQARLRDVRVCCGDWSRLRNHSVGWRNGVSAVFLDPPYILDDRAAVYAHDCGQVAHDAAKWAIENGGNPNLRIVFCGYEGNHEFPPDWDCVQWKTQGGYSSHGDGQGRENQGRERVWFSPHCLTDRQRSLF